MSVQSKHLLLISDNKGSVRGSFIFRVRVNTAVYLRLRKRVWGMILHDVKCLYSLTRAMLKLWRRARGHFVMLIKICVHLITCNPGHIMLWSIRDTEQVATICYVVFCCFSFLVTSTVKESEIYIC